MVLSTRSELTKGTCCIVDTEVHHDVLLGDCEHDQEGKDQVAVELVHDEGADGDQETIAFVDSEVVDHLVECLYQKKTLKDDLKHAICLELTLHFDGVQHDEVDELSAIKDVPEVFEVVESLLLNLKALENDEEYLGEKTNVVQDVEEEYSSAAKGHGIWHQEPKDVGQHHVLQEVLSSHKLEVNDLSDSLKVVEIHMFIIFNEENGGEMVVVELDMSVVELLDVSYLFSNDDLVKVDG